MSRLRVVGGEGYGRVPASLAVESKIALDVAADAALQGVDLAQTQLQALMNAASYTGLSENTLRAGITQRGNCTDEQADPEDWFLPYNEDEASHVDSPLRREVRAQATCACFGCPVKGRCLALSFALGEHGTQGVWGGLGERDRAELRPLWLELTARLGLTSPGTSDDNAATEGDTGTDAHAEFGDTAGAA